MACNVFKTIINHPFGNGLYNLFMVIWGMVYYCFNHVIGYMSQKHIGGVLHRKNGFGSGEGIGESPEVGIFPAQSFDLTLKD